MFFSSDASFKKLEKFNKDRSYIHRDRTLTLEQKKAEIIKAVKSLTEEMPFILDYPNPKTKEPVTIVSLSDCHSNEAAVIITSAISNRAREESINSSVYLDLDLDSHFKTEKIKVFSNLETKIIKVKANFSAEILESLELTEQPTFDVEVPVPVFIEQEITTVNDVQALANALTHSIKEGFDSFKVTNEIGDVRKDDTSNNLNLNSEIKKIVGDSLFDLHKNLKLPLEDGRVVDLSDSQKKIGLINHYQQSIEGYASDFFQANGVLKKESIVEKQEEYVNPTTGKKEIITKRTKTLQYVPDLSKSSNLTVDIFNAQEKGLVIDKETGNPKNLLSSLIDKIKLYSINGFASWIKENSETINEKQDALFYEYLKSKTMSAISDFSTEYSGIFTTDLEYKDPENPFIRINSEPTPNIAQDIMDNYQGLMNNNGYKAPDKPLPFNNAQNSQLLQNTDNNNNLLTDSSFNENKQNNQFNQNQQQNYNQAQNQSSDVYKKFTSGY